MNNKNNMNNEYIDNNRIIRPSADYIGPENRDWVDIESR